MSSLQSRTSQIASGRKPSFGCSNAQERSPSEAGYSEGSLPSDSETDDDSGYQLEDLDDPLECTFKAHDKVWVRTTGGEWYEGEVCSGRAKVASTRQGEGTYYRVEFRMNRKNVRKDFSPLNGDVKPNCRNVRALLAEGGWF